MTSLRERQAAAVRDAIVDAALDLFLEREDFDVPVQEIADRAGVSHRTVYRYFDDRKALVDEAAARFSSRLVVGPMPAVSTLDEYIDSVGERFAFFERNLDLFRAVVRATVGSPRHGRARDGEGWELFRRRFPHLDEATARRRYVVIRHLVSSLSFVALRDRFELEVAEAAEAVVWALSRLVEEIEEEDRALAGEATA